MAKLPRDIDGAEVVRGLTRIGYAETRQVGSHVRMTTQVNGEHHISVPLHRPLKVGTLAAILDEVAAHLAVDRSTLMSRMKL